MKLLSLYDVILKNKIMPKHSPKVPDEIKKVAKGYHIQEQKGRFCVDFPLTALTAATVTKDQFNEKLKTYVALLAKTETAIYVYFTPKNK
jgi:hypothetical protein